MIAHVNTYINLQYLKDIFYGTFGTRIDLTLLPVISSVQSVKVLNRVVCIHMYKLKEILFEYKQVNSNPLTRRGTLKDIN